MWLLSLPPTAPAFILPSTETRRCCHRCSVEGICGGLMPRQNLNTSVCLFFFFLCARRAFNYLLQKPFFPLHCDAACRLHLFDNQPPARRLRDTVWLQTRTKCMWTVFPGDSGMNVESCRRTQEHWVHITAFISAAKKRKKGEKTRSIFTSCHREKKTEWRLNLWPGGCSSVPLSARNTAVNEPKRHWFLLKRPLIIFLLLSVNRQPIDQGFLLPLADHKHHRINCLRWAFSGNNNRLIFIKLLFTASSLSSCYYTTVMVN